MPKEYVINYFSRNDSKIYECFEIVKLDASAADIYLNAFCYLMYRAREGKFEEPSFLLNRFEYAQSKLEDIEDIHSKARWSSSLVTAYCYLYIKLKEADDHIISIAEKAIDESVVQNWPRIMVNPIMLSLICIGYNIRNKNNEKANKLILKAFNIYKTAVAYSEINSEHIAHTVIHELKEATQLIGACILIGNFSEFCMDYTGLKNASLHLRNLIKGASSTNIAYDTFYKVFPELEVNT